MALKNAPRLPGGRGYNSGKNAYVNNSFQNEQRQQTIGGLAALYVWGTDQTISSSGSTAITFATYADAVFQTPLLRGFTLQPDNSTLTCTISGTYKIWAAMQIAPSTSQVLTVTIRIKRASQLDRAFSFKAYAGAGTTYLYLASPPFITDLYSGDSIQLTALASTGSPTLTAGTTSSTQDSIAGSGLFLEQLDIPKRSVQ